VCDIRREVLWIYRKYAFTKVKFALICYYVLIILYNQNLKSRLGILILRLRCMYNSVSRLCSIWNFGSNVLCGLYKTKQLFTV